MGIDFKYAKITELGEKIIETTQMDLANYYRPSNQSYLNWIITYRYQKLIIELDYWELFDVFELGINSNSNQILNDANNTLITITATIKRYKINFK